VRRSSYRIAVLLPVIALGGCATLEDFLDSFRGQATPAPVPLSERPVQEPISANHFVLATAEQSVIGVPQVVFTTREDTLSDLARAYGLGYDELLAANPDVDPWLPGENTPVLLPTQFVLPDVPRQGIVLNIASRRLFYFPVMPQGEPQVVKTYPIGIGRVGWETPLGVTKVTSKARDPHWFVPASVRREHAELGDPLPSVIPPGPDNPLGHRVLKLEMPGYLIHGTNQPYGVGMRVSHGCIRLYPENIELLYELVEIGEPVSIINEPYLFGRLQGELYFESHVPLEDDLVAPDERLSTLLDSQVTANGLALRQSDKDHVRAIASVANGVPARLSIHDVDEVLARVRLVRNTVETDPDAPTLTEVRELIDEAVREAQAEAEAL
jgi:L,D-transpeptidase ErfK/SrfK